MKMKQQMNYLHLTNCITAYHCVKLLHNVMYRSYSYLLNDWGYTEIVADMFKNNNQVTRHIEVHIYCIHTYIIHNQAGS